MTHREGACGLCCTRIENLRVTLGGAEVLRGVDLHMHCGEVTAIVGTNGAGKTTFLRALLGEVPHQGGISFLRADGTAAGMPRVGYVPQQLVFDRRSPIRVSDMFASALSRRPAFLGVSKAVRDHALPALSLVGVRDLFDMRLGALSGGQLQRVLLALAVTPLPDMLLLDEPVSGVDREGLEQFYTAIDTVRNACDLTCVLVTHDPATLGRLADRVVLLKDGRVAFVGNPDDYNPKDFE